MKIFLDTNVLVSAVATRGLCADVLHVSLSEHELLVSETVLDELQEVLRRKLRIPAAAIKEFDGLLRSHGLLVGAGATPTIKVRDASDAVILAEATAGGADVLVTGDHDLLDIADLATIQVLPPRGLWEQLRAS